MKRLIIAVLFGGISSEREISIASAEHVIEALKKNKNYNVLAYDTKTDLLKLFRDQDKIDVAMPILHGPYGEDGTIQGFLELLQIPYTHSKVLASALGANKLIQRKLYQQYDIPIPKYKALYKGDTLTSFYYPLVVKPNSQGSSIGVCICQNKQELNAAVKQAFKYDDIILVEDFIKGTEITVGVLGNSENPVTLPVIEIVPRSDFFNYKAKYDGTTQEIVPARISEKLARQAQGYAKRVHHILGCSGITRTDMIIGQHNQIFVLEINTIPGITQESLIPKAAKAAGISFEKLLDKLIELALEGNNASKKS